MADNIPCSRCGWNESDHQVLPIKCRYYSPDSIIQARVDAQRDREADLVVMFYENRQMTGQAIWEKMVAPLLSRGTRM